MALKNRSNLPDDLFFALSPAGQRSAVRLAHPRVETNPVVEVTVETMWDYAYQAKPPRREPGETSPIHPILACNSLPKLKEAVRQRRWPMAWLTCSEGALSYGQDVVDEYPYQPVYHRAPARTRA